MKKNLIAVAIAAAVAAPVAFADATVYGVAHMSYDNLDNGSTSVAAVSSNSSRIGIKGSEDLGAGLKAVYQFETTASFDGDTANTSGLGGQRNTFAGLAGGFGTVLLGKHDTPLKMMGRKYDLFGDQIGDTRALTGEGSWDLRPNNVIAYVTPNMGGFSAVLAYVNDENSTKNGAVVSTTNGSNFAADNTDAYSAMLSYSIGKFGVDAAYENHSKGIHGKAYDAVRVGASYDFGMAKVNAFYANQDRNTVGTSIKGVNIYGLGAGVKVGAAGTVKAQYFIADEINNGNNGASVMALGYDHKMSKNTTAYVAYAATNNDANGTYGVSTGGGHGEVLATAAGKDPSAISVGLIHKF